ncbi:MAG: hypothetical protein JSW47_19565 [Phycisphaerales bacterium]|nr:MAG: hypothetical protein JSW47_19565 [Phycisphaerales bacterium]
MGRKWAFIICLVLSGCSPDGGERAAVTTPGGTSAELSAAEPNVLRGQVCGPNGSPFQDAKIYVRAEWDVGKKPVTVGGMAHDRVTQAFLPTDAQGQFMMVLDKPKSISSVGLKELRIKTTAWTPDRRMCAFAAVRTDKEPIMLTPLTMVLSEPASATIRVVDRDGRGITTAKLVTERAEQEVNLGRGNGYVGGWLVQDYGDGAYRIEKLVPGMPCRLSVTVPSSSRGVLTDPFVPQPGQCIDLGTVTSAVWIVREDIPNGSG